jgi:alpha-beta hydrolase superfamily lysophospholipase
MKHIEGRFKGKKNVEIYWQSWIPAKPKAVVVLVHGLGEHSGRYRHVAESLVDAGCAVYAMDHRGHGKSGGPRALVDRFAYAVDDIDHVVELARREQPRKPTFLLGHSMGGALSLSYTLKHPGKLYALILSGPAVALDGAPPLMKPISKVLSAFAPKLGMFAIEPGLVSRDPSVAEDYAKDPLNAHGKVPARTLGEIVKFVEFLPSGLPSLQLPLLVMHGSEDKLAGVAGSRMVVNTAKSKDKTLKVYDGLYHEIFNELPADRAIVLKDLSDWISVRSGR